MGIKLPHYRTVQRKLPHIAPRRLGGRAGWGMIGLEIDDQDLCRRHHQPVDLPGNQRSRSARPLQPSRDRNLGAAAGAKYCGKALIPDQGHHAVRQRLALAVAPAIGIADQVF